MIKLEEIQMWSKIHQEKLEVIYPFTPTYPTHWLSMLQQQSHFVQNKLHWVWDQFTFRLKLKRNSKTLSRTESQLGPKQNYFRTWDSSIENTSWKDQKSLASISPRAQKGGGLHAGGLRFLAIFVFGLRFFAILKFDLRLLAIFKFGLRFLALFVMHYLCMNRT